MPLKISDSIDNYLKFKENIESLSPQSLRAYKSDLAQVFKNKQKLVLNQALMHGLEPYLTL